MTKRAVGGGLGISLEGTVDVEDGVEVRPHHYIRSILPNGPVGNTASFWNGDQLLEVRESAGAWTWLIALYTAGQWYRPDGDVPPGGRLYPEGGGAESGAGLLQESLWTVSSPRNYCQQCGH